MKTVEIVCDQCGHDIAYTTNSVGYRLALIVERKPIDPSCHVVTDLGIYPPIERDAHFCGVVCLAAWIGTKYPDAMGQYERLLNRRYAQTSRELNDRLIGQPQEAGKLPDNHASPQEP